MSNITPQFDLNASKSPEDFAKFAPQVITQVINQINGKLDFTNLSTQQVSIKSPGTPNQAFTIPHNLNKLGVNFIIGSKDLPGDVYRAGGDTVSTLVLKCTATNINFVFLLF